MRLRLNVALAGVFVLATFASAQVVRPVAPLAPPTTVTSGAEGQALISGTAVDAGELPLPSATIRLRNLETNQVERTTTTGPTGEFTFMARPEVPYVVEIADTAGRIVAVGDVTIAQAGDVAGAVVAIPARLPALAGMFTDTAGSVASAASGTGITAVQAGVMPFLTPEK
jgi:hypothetical protein